MAIKILSVDDELDMEMLIGQKFRKLIRDKKFEFIFAHNGVEALEKILENKDTDLILCDINMPEMDGLTFLGQLKEHKDPSLKVVMVSAYGDMDNIRSAMNKGAFDFVTKPINFEDLEITISKTINERELFIKAQKEHDQLIAIKNDLTIANDIQQAMLPKKFPPFPDRTDFDLHAFLVPAKSVGGDLYDYFLMDNNKLFFMIGDVSDKGVPAALFMARTKTLFKSHFSSKEFKNISEEVKQINAFLCEDNSSLMFVTAFICILDLSTGIIEYVDAGHEPPLILRKGHGIEILKKKGGMALCFDTDFDYQPGTIQINPGDGIVLYTDGLEDAKNEKGERNTLTGALEFLKPLSENGTPKEINDAFLSQTQQFIGNANQFDDITVVTLRYIGK